MMFYGLIFFGDSECFKFYVWVSFSHCEEARNRETRYPPNLVIFVWNWTNTFLKTQFYLESEDIEVNDIPYVF